MTDWKISKILFWADSYLKQHHIKSSRLIVELLLSHCLCIKRVDLYINHDRLLSKKELHDFKSAIKRRINNEPLEYIIGKKGFFESELKVSRHTLIPRFDTEILIEQAIKSLKAFSKKNPTKTFLKVLELGTGSGAIIISLAKIFPEHVYFASDVSFKALKVAKQNSIDITKNRISFFASSWFSSIKKNKQFDLIVSNPPYIPSDDIDNLELQIKKFEPLKALDGGKDGLASFRNILKNAHYYLNFGSDILLEIGFDQKISIKKLVSKYPEYRIIEFVKDLAGHYRVVRLQKDCNW